MLQAKKLLGVLLALCMICMTAGTVFAATESEQLKAAVKAVKDTSDKYGYTTIEEFVGWNDMTADEFLALVKKYIIPDGNTTTAELRSDADFRISNATAEKDGKVNVNVQFTCGKHTQREWVTIKIPKLTGASAVKSEDKTKIEADKNAVIRYLQTVTVTNDTTQERLLEGIRSAIVNGSVLSFGDDYNKREATREWAGFIKGTIVLSLNSEREMVSMAKNIANLLGDTAPTEVIPILERNLEYADADFADVSADAYYANAVNWAVSKNITAGTSQTTFSPDDTCTRAQILTFLWRASGSPKATAPNGFSDVSESDYYYDAAVWASEKGMVTGPTFDADTPCTRSATVMYLWQNAGSPAVALTQLFSDVLISKNYASAVCWAVSNHITSGTSETTFSPDTICSRGQIVTFLFRAS